MTNLSYNQEFTLCVSIPKRDVEQKVNQLKGYEFTTEVNKYAPMLTDFFIVVKGLKKFNALNDIILSD